MLKFDLVNRGLYAFPRINQFINKIGKLQNKYIQIQTTFVKIHGQIYHRSSDLYPMNESDSEAFAQLYILDDELALKSDAPETIPYSMAIVQS